MYALLYAIGGQIPAYARVRACVRACMRTYVLVTSTYFVCPVNSDLKDLIQFRIGAQETRLLVSTRRTRKADYKSRPGVVLVTHRQGLIIASRDVKNYAPDRRCGSFRGRHAKTTMSNASRSFTARIPRHHLVRLTQPSDPLYLLHGGGKVYGRYTSSFCNQTSHRATSLDYRGEIVPRFSVFIKYLMK